MLSGNSFLRLVYFTRQSKLTTNPKLIRFDLPHRQLRQPIHKKSYKYDLSGDHIVNKHLYFNQKENNKLKAQQYVNRKAKNLEIRPFTGENKQVQRPFGEILNELFNKKLIQQQPTRAFDNIKQVLRVYPEQGKQNHKALLWTLGEIEKQATHWSWRQFYSFCQLARKLEYVPTPMMFTTLYQHLYSAEAIKRPLPLQQFADLASYIFSTTPPEQIQKLILKDTTPLELFKYNDPRPFSFQQLLSKQYTAQYLSNYFTEANVSKRRSAIAQSLKIFGEEVSARINKL